jgi:hypothetical protein
MNKTTFQEFTLQLDKIAEFIMINSDLPKTKRKQATYKFTYQQRELNKNFVYFSVLNSSPAGETLAAQPTAKQKEMKQLFEDDADAEMKVCFIDFYDDKTVIDFRAKVPNTPGRTSFYKRTI